jgi:molybdopterin-guanine dinucleotide biosynthesis protein A
VPAAEGARSHADIITDAEEAAYEFENKCIEQWADADKAEFNDMADRTTRKRAASTMGTHELDREKYGASFAFAAHTLSTLADPKNYNEARRRPDQQQWLKATKEEYTSLLTHGTFTLVPLPPGRKAIGSRWVFKTKRNGDGSVARYKARLVAQGFSQRPGVDFVPDELSAPVASLDSIRTVLAVAAYHSWEILQMDVDTAYLNAAVAEEIYMRQPPGFVNATKDGEPFVCLLHRSLYGLKQAAYNWNQTITEFFIEMGFQASSQDLCVFTRTQGRAATIIVLYVDDLLITGNSPAALQSTKAKISQRFKTKDLGNVGTLLGMQVTRDREKGLLKITQTRYVEEMLSRYGLQDSNPVLTPSEPGESLSQDDCPTTEQERRRMQQAPYANLVGSLMYAARGTRPDIANAVRVLARFIQNPGEKHWRAAKRVLRYLSGTRDLGITYHRAGEPGGAAGLAGYSDADWAGDLDNRKSTTGTAFMLAGGVISFTSKLQTVVARSSTESEYIALFEAAQTAQSLRQLLKDVGEPQHEPTPLYEDNQACIIISNPKAYTKKSRTIDVKYHFTRELVEKGEICVLPIPTAQQLADICTKNLPAPRLRLLRDELLGSSA